MLSEGCRRVEPKFVEDEEAAWDQMLMFLDRWGDRRTPVNPDWDLANAA